MSTYSFMDVTATLAGVTGVVDLGFGSAVTKEGITVTTASPRNVMTPGADGEVMHSLKADKSGTVTVRLLYTSPVNATLQTMFNAQSLSSSAWGNNVIMCRSAAFQKLPDRTFAEEGQMVEWVFDCGKIDVITGSY